MIPAYDPYQHARKLGVQVVHRGIGKDTGRWIPRYGAIFLRPGMTARHERSVLAHEIAHVEYGHTASSRKAELLADSRAASRLVLASDFDELVKWTQELPELAIELGVTENIVRAYIRSR
ncbi:ImmA/IrrE family metallo-endopeptidase [Mycetocola sp. JXN-3]|uniref:ImmA/IrrE family metallo-endopeptidase n=1 Tax=Mycetocola TaxID=76634 RepID=UPI0005BA4A52